MYKLLIVEDEMLLRQGIVHMLNWTEHDFLIVGQVSNGKEYRQYGQNKRCALYW